MEKYYQLILQSLKIKRHRPFWKSTFWLVAVLTTFLTTYFLILPAITLEQQEADQVPVALTESTERTESSSSATSNEPDVTSSSPSSETPIAEVTTKTTTRDDLSQTKSETSTETDTEPFEGDLVVEEKNYTVKVTVKKDAKIPPSTRLMVTELTEEKEAEAYEAYRDQALDKVEKTLDDVKEVKLYDIKLFDGETEIQPQAPVTVQVSYPEPFEVKSEELEIVHFKDTGELEVLPSKETEETKKLASDIAFQTSSFSVYAIVRNATPLPRHTYTFENITGTPFVFKTATGADVSEQVVKDGESLKDVGLPTIGTHQHFDGWYYYDKATSTYGEKVVFGQPITITETKTVTIRPKYTTVAYVTLYDNAAGTVILQREQVTLTNDRGTYDLTAISAPPPTASQIFVGWSRTKGGSVISQDQARAMVITADTFFYPVFREARKVEFETGSIEDGATYIAPRYVFSGQTATAIKPPDPTRLGYTFAGWYTAPSGGTVFNFNNRVTRDTKIYARWTPAQANYTVIYWQQRKTDSKTASSDQKTYDYAGQRDLPGTVDSTVNLRSSDYTVPTGFQLNTDKTTKSVTVKGDGSAVLNVYFDRKLITMKFYKGSSVRNPSVGSWVWDERYVSSTDLIVHRGLYGTSLSDNGYSWPSTDNGQNWAYYTSTDTRGMSYLGEFILPTDVADPNNAEIRFFKSGNKRADIYFYKQNLDGSYSETPNDIGNGSGGEFYFSEKYAGFTVSEYKRFYIYRGSEYSLDRGWNLAVSGSSVATLVSGYYTDLHIRYARKSFGLNFLDPLTDQKLSNFPSKQVKYELPLAGHKPDTRTSQPVPSRPGYRWNGKWYKDKAQTQEFDWTGTMPAHDVAVYAGWEKITHKVTIDPDGGEVPRTQLTVDYGGKIPDYYSTATRDYVPDPAGTHYYRYDTEAGTRPTDGIYKSAYTTKANEPNVDRDQKYSYEKDGYKLLGWYQIKPDGSKSLFSFDTVVTSDITLKAEWRRVGEYHLTYSNQAYDQDGQPLTGPDGSAVQTSVEPVDGQRYDDRSSFAFLSRPTIPEGYAFKGWWYNGKLYNPYNSATLFSHLADSQKTIIIHPVLVAIENLPTKDTFLIYDGNGGKRLENGQEKDRTEHRQLTLNKTYRTKGATYFSRAGYELIGWHTDKNAADAGVIEFEPDQEIGLDNEPNTANTLYAVWRPKNYTVKITKKVVGLEQDKTERFKFLPNESLASETFELAHDESRTFQIPYDTDIAIGEHINEEFDTTMTVTHKNRPTGEANETKDLENGSPVLVDGDIEIVFTNTRNRQLVALQKVSVENINKPLSGAVFNLYTLNSRGEKVLAENHQDLVSGEDGHINVLDSFYFPLPVGDYRLTELKAPDGYNIAQNDLKLKVTPTGVTLMQEDNAAPMEQVPAPEDGSPVYLFKVTNSRGTELPSTGGIGSHVVSLAGGGITLMAVLLLYVKKRQQYH